jgi:hypothetical protein
MVNPSDDVLLLCCARTTGLITLLKLSGIRTQASTVESDTVTGSISAVDA